MICREAGRWHEEQLNELRETFYLLDDDASGEIDVCGLKDTMRSLGFEVKHEKPKNKEFKKIVRLDGDCNGTDCANFLATTIVNADEKDSHEDIEMFKLFDDITSSATSNAWLRSSERPSMTRSCKT